MTQQREWPLRALGGLAAAALLAALTLPVVALGWSVSWADLRQGVGHELFLTALRLSVETTLVAVGLSIVGGTPLAWWLATTRSRLSRAVEVIVQLPIVIPPAVVGVGLLQAFGPAGMIGQHVDMTIPFTRAAVVIAQVVVASPFFVQGAAAAFRAIDGDLMLVAKTLGATDSRAFFRVAMPLALPGLVAGASLAWARALGEFGATLLFAGNMPGRTQTMPLAIFAALESDVHVAIVLSLALAALGVVLLVLLRGSVRAEWSA